MASQGPNSPATLADDAAIGTKTWSDPSFAASSNNSYAQVYLNSVGGISHYLKVTNFGFSIPSGTIDGITVEVERTRSGSAATFYDHTVSLVVGGTVVGNNKAVATNWAAGEITVTYGGSSDLWGLTPSVSEINASDFGLVFSVVRTGGGKHPRALVDHIKITIYYTVGSSGPNALLFIGD